MADFSLTATAGTTLEEWEDPAEGSAPSRINAHAGKPPRHRVGAFGVPIRVAAVIGGVVAPADGTLGGRLFTMAVVEAPGGIFPGMTQPTGKTSEQQFTPLESGHYVVQALRPGGGLFAIHFDV